MSKSNYSNHSPPNRYMYTFPHEKEFPIVITITCNNSYMYQPLYPGLPCPDCISQPQIVHVSHNRGEKSGSTQPWRNIGAYSLHSCAIKSRYGRPEYGVNLYSYKNKYKYPGLLRPDCISQLQIVSQPWRKSVSTQPWRKIGIYSLIFLHSCAIKTGHGRPEYEVNVYSYCNKYAHTWNMSFFVARLKLSQVMVFFRTLVKRASRDWFSWVSYLASIASPISVIL